MVTLFVGAAVDATAATGDEGAMAALSIEQVLAEEAEAIQGTKGLADALLKDLVAAPGADAKKANADEPYAKDAKVARYRMDADQRSGEDLPVEEVKDRKAFYRALNKLNRAALCCSGGGIRSATFCLGVIQALAAYDVGGAAPAPANDAPQPDKAKPETKAEGSLLGCFRYLSTVSGGGYVGSWLSSWLKRNEFHQVIENLTGRPSGPDVEPPEISWLRAYSNYLTPRLGILSADAWTAVAIFVRNLLLNWLIIIPVVCLALLSLKLTATVSVWVAHALKDSRIMIPIALIGAICLVIAQAFTNRHRPTRRAPHANVPERTFLLCDLAWAVASAIFLTVFLLVALFRRRLRGEHGIYPAVAWSHRHSAVARVRYPIEVSAAGGDRRLLALRGRLDRGTAFRQRRPGFPCMGGVGPGLWSAGGPRRLSVFPARALSGSSRKNQDLAAFDHLRRALDPDVAAHGREYFHRPGEL